MITLRAETIARIMAIVIAALVTASVAIQIIAAVTGFYTMHGLVRFFRLDEENNLPTWYSAATLLFSSVLLAFLGVAEGRNKTVLYWRGLSLLFLLLSIDEVGSFHEIFIIPLRRLLRVDGIFHFAWVLPAGLLVLLVMGVYARWFFGLPPRTRNLMGVAGVLFLGGALGLEMAGGLLASRGQLESAFYIATATLEETAEMCGVLVWIYAILDYARTKRYQWTLQLFTHDLAPDRHPTLAEANERSGGDSRDLLRGTVRHPH
jgi:hypothetical protein